MCRAVSRGGFAGTGGAGAGKVEGLLATKSVKPRIQDRNRAQWARDRLAMSWLRGWKVGRACPGVDRRVAVAVWTRVSAVGGPWPPAAGIGR